MSEKTKDVDEMRLLEIVEGYFQARPTTQDEMIYTIQEYIRIRKGKDVIINIFKKTHPGMKDTVLWMHLQNQLGMLTKAMDAAVVWMLNNKQEWDQ